MILNASDYNSLTSALADALDGDVVYCPAIASAYVAPTGGFLISKSIELRGDGPGSSARGGGTVLTPPGANGPVISIGSGVRGASIRDLRIQGSGGSGTSPAISCIQAPNAAAIEDLSLRRVHIIGMPGDGISLSANGEAQGRIARTRIRDCVITNVGGAGIRITNALGSTIEGVYFSGCVENAIAVSGGSVGIYQCYCRSSATKSGWTRATNPNDGTIKCVDCRCSRIDGCVLENIDAGGVKRGIVIVGVRGPSQIGACSISGGGAYNPQGIVVIGAGTGPVSVLPNRFDFTGTLAELVVVDENTQGGVVFAQHSEHDGSISLGSLDARFIVLGTSQVRGGAPKPSGAIVPSSPSGATHGAQPGMIAYNTSLDMLQYYTGSAWKNVPNYF